MKLKFSKIRVFSIFSAIVAVTLISVQIASATIYQPGQTLEPDCAPGAPSCGVAIFSLNGQSSTTQTMIIGSSGSDFAISSTGNIHTFNIPSSSAVNRGLLTAADWSIFNGKQSTLISGTNIKTVGGMSLLGGGDIAVGGIGTVTSVISANADLTVTSTTTAPVLTIVSAPKLTTARTIGGVSFDGTANITVASATGGFAISGGDLALGTNSITMSGSLGTTGTRLTKGWFTDLQTTNAIVGSITGNAGTATALQTGRTINGTTFDGTSNITVTAAAGTLTGATLASGVTASSLTSLGTLSSLALSGAVTGATSYNGLVITANTGAITTGTWNGTTIAVANGGTGTTNGSITGTGALSFISSSTNSLILDSGTTGAVNIGTSSNAKIITIGNSTGATAVNINSGTGNINFTVDGTGSSGKVQIGNSNTATPDLLVLDNGTADPTGVNGGMYYNSSTTKFRCFQNGAWADCVGGDKKFVVKGTDQNIPSGTTLTNDTALTFSVGASETWIFQFNLQVSNISSANPDWQAAILGASGWTCSYVMHGEAPGTGRIANALGTDCDNAPTAVVDAGVASDTGIPYEVILQGSITTTSAGSVTLQWAPNTSGSLTMKAGSFVIAQKVGGADVAEVYYTKDLSITSGDVVSVDSSIAAGVQKSTKAYDSQVLGIISTRSGVLLGDGGTNTTDIPVVVALSGRVPVKVVTENGDIVSGDYLTSSSIPGVAMKSNGTGPVIGQALSAYSGEATGTVLAFIKNFDLGDVSPKADIDIPSIQSEILRDPIGVITAKIAEGKKLINDFIVARVTAIRGYFDELFARKIHTEELCLKKSDGSEVCLNGDQAQSMLNGVGGSVSSPVEPTPEPTSSITPQTTPGAAPEVTPEASPSIEVPDQSNE